MNECVALADDTIPAGLSNGSVDAFCSVS